LCQDCSLVGDISHFGEKGMRDEVANWYCWQDRIV
jgi:hypothetical protein